MATSKTRPPPKLKAPPPVKGPLPDRITYHLRSLTTMARGWDQLADEPGVPVNPAFPTDADNPKTQATAASWAAQGTYLGNGKWSEPKAGPVYTVPNAPIAGVTVVSLEERGEGGRAWKVIVEPSEDHPPGCVDLREGPLLETLITEGCEPGGVLRGTFVWARGGGSLRLVRVGSPVHKGMVEEMAALTKPREEVEALIPGHAYCLPGKHREVTIYLGRASTMRVTEHWQRDQGNTYTGAYVPSLHVWLDLYTHQNTPPAETLRNAMRRTAEDEALDEEEDAGGKGTGKVVLRNSPRPVVEDLGDARGLLTDAERADLFAFIRRDAVESITPRPTPPGTPRWQLSTPRSIESRLASEAAELYLRPWMGPLPEVKLPPGVAAEVAAAWKYLGVEPR